MTCPECTRDGLYFDMKLNRYVCPGCGARFYGEDLL